ncbi:MULTISPECIES: hypothetical protein [Sphingobium]|uniref:Uncharacterized protein n=1 Tax=Sphingobium baderi TaxID=1332080 RepID=A0A0S3F5D6_9SPHN|nr:MULTISPECIES: hypothetical protein [Sphingobium]ALR22850.1 hypothetical protein ATN00_20315 [Sphingobium baderi]
MPIRQPDLFFGDKQPPRSAPPLRAYRKAEKSPPAAFAWESMASWVRHMNRLFAVESPSCDHYERVRCTARELTVERIRLCRHADDLARCEAMLAQANSGWLYGLDRAFTRAERGERLVEVRNRIVLLGLGRAAPRTKGPRLDPASLPDDALLRLIQSHADPQVVVALRAERQRRLQTITGPKP